MRNPDRNRMCGLKAADMRVPFHGRSSSEMGLEVPWNSEVNGIEEILNPKNVGTQEPATRRAPQSSYVQEEHVAIKS